MESDSFVVGKDDRGYCINFADAKGIAISSGIAGSERNPGTQTVAGSQAFSRSEIISGAETCDVCKNTRGEDYEYATA